MTCLTDNTRESWFLDEDAAACPTNTSHTIDPKSVTIDHIIEESVVKIQEEYKTTGGKWVSKGFWVPGTTGPSDTITDFVWDNDISVLNIQINSMDENMDDSVHVYVVPQNVGYGEGLIGAISATAPTGATGILVGQTILDNVLTGDYLSLKEGGKEQDLGNILSVNKVTGMVYFKNPLETQFAVTSPTLVAFRRYIMEDFTLGPKGVYVLGSTKIGASSLLKGNIARVKYINNEGTSKRLSVGVPSIISLYK